VQPTARRSGITVENLKAPVRKNAATVASSEPPLVLTPQGYGSAENMLGGLLAGAGPPKAPAPPAAFLVTNLPAHPDGQLEAPKLVYSPAPLYPAMARTLNLQGVVVVDALVGVTGNVTEMKVVSGPMLLRQAAMDALRNWKYQPARLNGQPIALHTNLNFSFTLR
jgi:periplasmic protein TonB